MIEKEGSNCDLSVIERPEILKGLKNEFACLFFCFFFFFGNFVLFVC